MPRQYRVRFRHHDRVSRQLRLHAKKNPKWTAEFQYLEMEQVMTEAKRITPVDRGYLRASGHVRLPKVRAKRVSIVMGFGGPSAPYAFIVHETPPPGLGGPGQRTARHRAPTQWKFLEVPFNARKKGMLERHAEFLLKKMQSLRRPPRPPGAKR